MGLPLWNWYTYLPLNSIEVKRTLCSRLRKIVNKIEIQIPFPETILHHKLGLMNNRLDNINIKEFK